MTGLPPFVALRATFNKKEQFVANTTEGNRQGFLKMSLEAELVVNPKAKFAVEPSTGGLVNIRSCYNNKYWCRDSRSDTIVAAAGKPVEDKGERNCTLFRLEFSGKTVSFYHLGTNSSVGVQPIEGQWLLNVKASSVVNQHFTPVDTESIVKLPKRVTFKGYNGKYLRGSWQQSYQYNEFSEEDGLDTPTHYETFYTENGDIQVLSMHYGKYWRRSPNWIWADFVRETGLEDSDTLFEVIKVSDRIIALRNRGNNRICKALTTEGKTNCLNAASTSIEVEARLEVGEPVISRTIDVQFRLKDARIHHQTPLIAASVIVPNETDKEHEITEGLSYSETQVSTWNNTISVAQTITAKIKTGIPFIAEGEFEESTQFTEAIQFGKSFDFSKAISVQYKVPVPPMTKATVKVVGTEAKYDIPFSYIQTDTYPTGEKVTTVKEDGIYQGVQAYNFYYKTEYEPIM